MNYLKAVQGQFYFEKVWKELINQKFDKSKPVDINFEKEYNFGDTISSPLFTFSINKTSFFDLKKIRRENKKFSFKLHPKRQFAQKLIKEIKSYTDRPIEIRPKVGRDKRVSYTVQDQLRSGNYHCIVTYNSIAALEAMVHGKPAIVLGPNCAQDIAETSLSRIEFVKHPGRKTLTYLCRYLSNNQFTYDEMLSGYAWRTLTCE